MIKLHNLDGCPFCLRVQKKLEELGLKYKIIDAEADDFATVLKIAPQDMVPVIEDGDKVIQDSAKIIAYLEETYGKANQLSFFQKLRHRVCSSLESRRGSSR